jgi:hypothetical protein
MVVSAGSLVEDPAGHARVARFTLPDLCVTPQGLLRETLRRPSKYNTFACKAIFDFDLASSYEVEIKPCNQAIEIRRRVLISLQAGA